MASDNFKTRMEKKRDELSKLGKQIDLRSANATKEQMSEVENCKFRLDFRTKNLLEKFQEEEIDTKIAIFNEVLKVLE